VVNSIIVLDAFTENLTWKFIGFDHDCEIESDSCFHKNQMYESRGVFWML